VIVKHDVIDFFFFEVIRGVLLVDMRDPLGFFKLFVSHFLLSQKLIDLAVRVLPRCCCDLHNALLYLFHFR